MLATSKIKLQKSDTNVTYWAQHGNSVAKSWPCIHQDLIWTQIHVPATPLPIALPTYGLGEQWKIVCKTIHQV